MLISHMPLRNRKRGDAETIRELNSASRRRREREFLRPGPGHEILGTIDVASEAFGAHDTAGDAGVAGKRLVPCKAVVAKTRRDQIRPAHRKRVGSAVG